ncbi:unnamed protein product, partial [Prorocentrum cordatum]
AAGVLLYSCLPSPDAFVAAPAAGPRAWAASEQALAREPLTPRAAGKGPGERRGGRPSELDEQFGKPPPTEPPFETTQELFYGFAAILVVLLVGFIFLTRGAFTESQYTMD